MDQYEVVAATLDVIRRELDEAELALKLNEKEKARRHLTDVISKVQQVASSLNGEL